MTVPTRREDAYVTRIVAFLKHNVIALAALFVALGGTSYAAIAIPRNSVGTRQLRRSAVTATKIHSGAITPGKLSSRSFGGRILDFAEIDTNGAVAVSDPRGAKTKYWNPNTGGAVVFSGVIPARCYPLAGAASTLGPTLDPPVSVGASIGMRGLVGIAYSAPVPVTLVVICPR
jgi:hypothetical protein